MKGEVSYMPLIIPIIVILLISSNIYAEEKSVDINIMPGKKSVETAVKAPEFTLPDINKKDVSLKDFNEKTVLLSFWASWCPVCKEKIPKLIDLYSKTSRDEFEILALNLDNSFNIMSKFVKKTKINYKVLFDKKGEVAQKYKVMGIPSYFIIDKTGNLTPFGSDFNALYKKLVEIVKLK